MLHYHTERDRLYKSLSVEECDKVICSIMKKRKITALSIDEPVGRGEGSKER